MTSDYLFRKYAEHHTFTFREVSIGKYTFCSGVKECSGCKILSECQQFSATVKPSITKMELDTFKLENPEYFV